MTDPLPSPDPHDCYAPPAEPCECFCLHCQRVINSADMWFQPVTGSPDGFAGFWMCPTPNCGGAGFSFDIHPTDPDHPANEGWHHDDGDGAYDEDEDQDTDALTAADGGDAAGEYDPAEPHYPSDDDGDDPDALEGEEWKHGLQPGERPPESAGAAAGRAAWEAQQRKYDEPDRRPRSIDGSHWKGRRVDPPAADAGPDAEITEDDIPF